MKKPEILSPIQDFMSLRAAIDAGCDAVYFGIKGYNMRAGAKNFTVSDLKKIVKICSENNVRTYLALNTILYEDELKKTFLILAKAKEAGISAIICWDHAVIKEAKRLGMEIHLSTQASVANSEALKFYADQGVTRFVLARECSLEQIKQIKKKIHGISRSIPLSGTSLRNDITLETFIHGAMCVSVSGRCFLSQFEYGKSANRGECLQPCRRKYLIKQTDGDKPARNDSQAKRSDSGGEFEIGEDYILSPKDLCTLPFIEKLIEAGIDVFKIEGRNRSPEYVATVTKVYRKVVDFYFEYLNKVGTGLKPVRKTEFENLKKELMQELKKVYNREFSSGFYLGRPISEWTHSYGSQATHKKIHLGKVVHYYPKINVAEIQIQANKTLKLKDNIIIQGQETGILQQSVVSMEKDHKQIKSAKQGDTIAIKVDKKVKRNDEVYKIVKN